MLESAEPVLTLIVAILGVLQIVRAHRRAIERFPPRDYAASPQSPARTVDGWRWRSPPEDLGLRVVDRDDTSSLLLGDTIPTLQKVCSALAYGILALMAWGVLYRLFVIGWGPEVKFGVFLLILPWVLLHVGSRPVQIDLRPDELVVVVRYGILLRRSVHVQRRPGLRVSGTVQSSLAMMADQERPDTIVRIRRPGFWRMDRRFELDCNPSQGSWITGGLREWAEQASP